MLGPQRKIHFTEKADGRLQASRMSGCSTNLATGEKHLNLVSESQEISMGKEYDTQVQGSLGLYDNPELQRYIRDLGTRIAAKSGRECRSPREGPLIIDQPVRRGLGIQIVDVRFWTSEFAQPDPVGLLCFLPRTSLRQIAFDYRPPLPYLTAAPLVLRAAGITHVRVGFP
jgi:hypothetical protein